MILDDLCFDNLLKSFVGFLSELLCKTVDDVRILLHYLHLQQENS